MPPKPNVSGAPVPPSGFRAALASPWLYGLIAAILLGWWLRGHNLGYLSLWGDELNHVFAAESLVRTGEPLLPSGQRYDRVLFFTRLIAVADRSAGVGEVSNRFFPLLFGVLTIPCVYLLGLRLFGDRRVALLAALMIAVVPWYVIRARIVRIYTLYQLSYLVIALLAHYGFEYGRGGGGPGGGGVRGWLAANGINVWALAAAGVLAAFWLLQYPLSFEIIPVLAVYCALVLAVRVKRDGFRAHRTSKYALIVYAAVAGGLVLPPLFFRYSYVPFEKLLPGGFTYWTERFSTAPFYALGRYFRDTVMFLHPVIWVPGLLGTVLCFAGMRRNRLYAVSFILVPFLIQGGVFNHPGAVKAQYLFFAFPFFLLIAAYAIVRSVDFVADKTGVAAGSRTTLALVAGIALVYVPAKQSFAFVQAKKHGDIGDRSTERYADWRDACGYVRPRIKDGEPVVTSQPWSVYYYLGRADYYIRTGFNRIMFLREGYDTLSNFRKNPNPPVWPLKELYSGTEMLRDFNAFRWNVERHRRGWIIACHKFYNPAFVDKRIVEYVHKNMKRVFVDKDRSVAVFMWNRPVQSVPVAEVTSEVYETAFTLPDPRRLQGRLRLQVDIKGAPDVFDDYVSVNGGEGLAFRRVPGPGRQIMEAEVPAAMLRKGSNTLEFSAPGGPEQAYSLYHVGMSLTRGEIDYHVF